MILFTSLINLQGPVGGRWVTIYLFYDLWQGERGEAGPPGRGDRGEPGAPGPKVSYSHTGKQHSQFGNVYHLLLEHASKIKLFKGY